MDIKRFIIGTVVGAITLYALGYLIWELAFADFFAANAGSATGVVKDPQVIWALAAQAHPRPRCLRAVWTALRNQLRNHAVGSQ